MRTRSDEEEHHQSADTSSVHHLWRDSMPHPVQGVSPTSGQIGGTSSSSYDVTQSSSTSGMLPLAGTTATGSGSGTSSGRTGHARPTGGSGGAAHAPLPKRAGGGIQVGEHTGFLRMRGLPFAASKEDIIQFFAGYNPIPESVVLTYRNDGRVTGEAYIGFSSTDDAKRAIELHRRSMGNRYIELFISNKEEQGRALARFGGR